MKLFVAVFHYDDDDDDAVKTNYSKKKESLSAFCGWECAVVKAIVMDRCVQLFT